MFVLVLLSLAGVLKHSSVLNGGDPPKLQYRFEAAPATGVGQPLSLRFTLYNRTPLPVCVLRWYTPLEGLRGNILRVTLNGKELPYRGMMVKRENPTREDYACIPARGSVSKEFNLGESYDLSAPGRYRVAFVDQVRDYAWDEALIPRAGRDHRACKVDSLRKPFEFERKP
jgi:hypothetical protein